MTEQAKKYLLEFIKETKIMAVGRPQDTPT